MKHHQSKLCTTRIENFGGNVTLHPAVAPQLVNDSELVTATERNAAHC